MRFSRRLWCGALLLAYLLGGCRELVQHDTRRHHQPDHLQPLPDSTSLIGTLDALTVREFRTVAYTRLRNRGGFRRVIEVASRPLPGQVALFISSPPLGGGLYMLHGFSAIIVAEQIGNGCLIAQQVTIRYGDAGELLTLGDRARGGAGAGAQIIGRIHIGNDASIGANAVVIRDVPAGAIVGGTPARIPSRSPTSAATA